MVSREGRILQKALMEELGLKGVGFGGGGVMVVGHSRDFPRKGGLPQLSQCQVFVNAVPCHLVL